MFISLGPILGTMHLGHTWWYQLSHDSPIHSFKKAPVYVSTFGWFLNMQGWSGFQLGESKTPVEKKNGYHFLDAHPEVRKWIIIIIIFYPSCMWDIPKLYVGLLTTYKLGQRPESKVNLPFWDISANVATLRSNATWNWGQNLNVTSPTASPSGHPWGKTIWKTHLGLWRSSK